MIDKKYVFGLGEAQPDDILPDGTIVQEVSPEVLERRAKFKLYRDTHKDKVKVWKHTWYTKHLEIILTQKAEEYANRTPERRDEINARRRALYLEQKSEGKTYYQKHRDEILKAAAERYQQKKQAQAE